MVSWWRYRGTKMGVCMFDYGFQTVTVRHFNSSTSCARSTGLSFFFTNPIDEFYDKVY